MTLTSKKIEAKSRNQCQPTNAFCVTDLLYTFCVLVQCELRFLGFLLVVISVARMALFDSRGHVVLYYIVDPSKLRRK